MNAFRVVVFEATDKAKKIAWAAAPRPSVAARARLSKIGALQETLRWLDGLGTSFDILPLISFAIFSSE
jgi:hypothetical protein